MTDNLESCQWLDIGNPALNKSWLPQVNTGKMTRIGWVFLNHHYIYISAGNKVNTNYVNQYGLGSMGLAMANNLQCHLVAKKVPGLLYSNRTVARGNPLQALGGTPEGSFEKVVGQCGIIFTMVLFLSPPLAGEEFS